MGSVGEEGAVVAWPHSRSRRAWRRFISQVLLYSISELERAASRVQKKVGRDGKHAPSPCYTLGQQVEVLSKNTVEKLSWD